MNDNLDFLSLRNKNVVDDNIKFLSNQYVIDDIDSIPIMGIVYVDEKYLCRLDILFEKQYGTMQFFDLFLKYNNIHDPLSVTIGQKILFPDLFALKTKSRLVDLSIPTLNKESIRIGVSRAVNDKSNETAVSTRSILKNRGNGVKIDNENGLLIF